MQDCKFLFNYVNSFKTCPVVASDHNIVLIVQVAVFQVFRLRGFTASNNENISV